MKNTKVINYAERFSGSTRIAIKVGLNAAVVHAKIAYFINENKKADRNLINGLYWTYATYEELQENIPYLSIKQIRFAIQKLKEQGLIVTDNFNKRSGDHTTWYAIPDNVMELGYPKAKR